MIDDGNVFAFWDFLSRHALWIAVFLVLPLWWWMRQYKGERAGQAERQLGDLARLLGATLRRDDAVLPIDASACSAPLSNTGAQAAAAGAPRCD